MSTLVRSVTVPTASNIANTPAGGIEALNIQAAINELDSEKVRIDELANGANPAKGAGLVVWIRNAVGAVAATLSKWLGWQAASVFDFMTDAERADALSGAPVLDHTASFQKAIDASNVLTMPEARFRVSKLKINKNYFTLKGVGYSRSIIEALGVGEITIEVAGENSVSFPTLRDFKVQGNATALGGIKLGSSAANYCAGAMLENLGVWDYSKSTGSNGFGVQLACVQNLTVNNCWIYRNRHQYQRLQGTGYATSVKISGKTGYAGEGYIGAYIDAQIDDLYIDDVILEGNANSAVIVTANAVLPERGSSIYINGPYFEFNNELGAGVISITGGAGAYQEHVLVIDRTNFSMNSGFYVTLDRVIATIKNSKLMPAQISTTENVSVHFENNRYPNAANYLETYRALLGNITVRDTNDPYDGTTPNQINLVNAVTFPATPRSVADPYTLDDYREGVWEPVLSSDGVAPTYANLEAPDGTYTKIGNLVFCRGKIRASISNVGTGTPRVIGLPFQSKGLEPPSIGLSTLLTTVEGTEYMVSGPAVVFNGAAYQLTSEGYLVFSVVYQTA